MITPNDIQAQCLKWWREVLINHIDGSIFSPRKIIRIGKVSSKDILNKLTTYKEEISLLKQNSKGIKKYSYSLVTEERLFNKIGPQTVPVRISIDSIEDYLLLLLANKKSTCCFAGTTN